MEDFTRKLNFAIVTTKATLMQSWDEIRQQFKDQWVAISPWEENEHGDITQGNVAYHSSDRNEFDQYLKTHLEHQELAIRYTGAIEGPFFLDQWR